MNNAYLCGLLQLHPARLLWEPVPDCSGKLGYNEHPSNVMLCYTYCL